MRSCDYGNTESIENAGEFAKHIAAALDAFDVEWPVIARKRRSLPVIPATGHPITQDEINAAQEDL